MYDIYLTLRSVTRGQKGKGILDRAGIPNALLRAPRQIAEGGCGYALALRQRDRSRARELLALARLPVEGSFLRSPDGSFTRLQP